ncbi:MAG: hydroxymethylbilane synthase [Planctomycetota bacterium]|jgi:hydroxymethylbilane synthase|nr:hydroxymethylbilane synthase [Planctomycetota bacterium]
MIKKCVTIRIATRKSPLAVIQAEFVKVLLEEGCTEGRFDVTTFSTLGDTRLNKPLAALGGKGLFTKEIDHAVFEGEADLAVHSLKDLPTELPKGLILAGCPARESWRDVLATSQSETLASLPDGASIGCGSVRRRAQLLRLRPDFRFHDVRGNIHTRLVKSAKAGWAGVVMARSALDRLGFDVPRLDLGDHILPAAGQGALGLVCRENDETVKTAIQSITHAATFEAVLCERAFWRRIGAGCHAAAAVLAKQHGDGGRFSAAGRVLSADGTSCLEDNITFQHGDAVRAGARLAESLLRKGAERVMAAL